MRLSYKKLRPHAVAEPEMDHAGIFRDLYGCPIYVRCRTNTYQPTIREHSDCPSATAKVEAARGPGKRGPNKSEPHRISRSCVTGCFALGCLAQSLASCGHVYPAPFRPRVAQMPVTQPDRHQWPQQPPLTRSGAGMLRSPARTFSLHPDRHKTGS